MNVITASDQAHELERARHPERALAEAVASGNLKMVEILKAIGVNPNDPTHQAALLACERYELDPLLKHIVVIPRGGPYITRDGWLHIAHRSGEFDGMEVADTGETPTHWTAKVAVFRKDMGRPFTYVGRYPKSGSNKTHGPEMAIKVAEVAALRRAFPVSGVGAYEERWQDIDVPAPVAPVTADEIQAANTPVNVTEIDYDDGETLIMIDDQETP
jgi:hypothetical protein